ncbi:MAG TPA: L-histidine N(alpha)-methyltransferase [Polyangiaceae bacterium]
MNRATSDSSKKMRAAKKLTVNDSGELPSVSSSNAFKQPERTTGTVDIRESSVIARIVREGLTKEAKQLPPWLFYDEEGSRLFVEITKLPEYYLARAERSIFEEQGELIVRQAKGRSEAPLHFAELGAGVAEKSQILVHKAAELYGSTTFLATDTSESALDIATERFEREEPDVEITPIAVRHETALRAIAHLPALQFVLFIGSSIGNYADADAKLLLQDVRKALRPGAAFLLGTDLVKDPSTLVAAYDDAAGVTAAFNKNMLVRINRELGAHFDVDRFAHRAIWNHDKSRIEMHLESLEDQIVRIDALDLAVSFKKGERIFTESSHKYTVEKIDAFFEAAGFRREKTFFDDEKRFGVHVARAI